MNIFTNLFNKIFRPKVVYSASLVGSRSAPWSKEVWASDVVRATIDTIATHAAKGQIRHVVLDENGAVKKIVYNSVYAKLLNLKPNPWMSGQELKYRMVAQLENKTTAMAYIKWNGSIPEMIIPVDYQDFEVKELQNGGYCVEFTDLEGDTRYLLIEDVIMIRKYYCNNQASGDGNAPLYSVLSMNSASDEGFIESLKLGNKVRGVYKHKVAMLDKEDVLESQREFEERFRDAAENGGVITVDSSEDYTPITQMPYSAQTSQMREVINRIHSYFRTPEEIVQSKYSEHVGQAWYESVIEPIWEKLAEALTNACFTQREKDVGNRLIINAGVMMGTSYQTRINIISQTKDIGLLSINEQRELLGLGPVEGGDKRLASLNYVNVDKMDEYQGTGTPPSYKDDKEDNSDGEA